MKCYLHVKTDCMLNIFGQKTYALYIFGAKSSPLKPLWPHGQDLPVCVAFLLRSDLVCKLVLLMLQCDRAGVKWCTRWVEPTNCHRCSRTQHGSVPHMLQLACWEHPSHTVMCFKVAPCTLCSVLAYPSRNG